jgi:lipoate-protein ligase A
MKAKVSEKVAGGKLVRLELEHDASKITRAKITGDFFLHPEELLQEMEKALVGMPCASSEADLTAKISAIASFKHAEMVGFSPEVIGRLAKQAVSAPAEGAQAPA